MGKTELGPALESQVVGLERSQSDMFADPDVQATSERPSEANFILARRDGRGATGKVLTFCTDASCSEQDVSIRSHSVKPRRESRTNQEKVSPMIESYRASVVPAEVRFKPNVPVRIPSDAGVPSRWNA